ncbi:MAG: tetratricopeptide repeat protein [Actinobacteria bacterium]|nr:tetratricopeptide repeat protein [Actinomycetota bacterium]MBU1942051.1 tetratricopeptide repeat protein [Actinomycetota bacterium]MBU2687178.1 tetratricopeptide repeat protein [Actinomycetota bacterium]
MECMICGKRFGNAAAVRFCDRCGAELIDGRREHELCARLAEAPQGEERARVEEELAAYDAMRQAVKSRWVAARMGSSARLLEEGRLRAAAEEIQPALKADPSNPELHMLMARILSAAGEFGEARQAAKYALYLSPGDVRIQEYIEQLSRMRRSGRRQARDTAVHAAAPPPPPPRRPRPPRRERPDLSGWMHTLVEKGLLRWWYFVGTFILMAGVIGLVTWKWSLVGDYFVFSTVLAVACGLYVLGHYLAKRIRLGSTIVFVLASSLVPLVVYLFSDYRIAGVAFDPNLLGIAGAIIAAAVYAVNFYRTRNQALFAFLVLTPLALLFFILRGSGVSNHFWGLWIVGLTAGYFAAGYIMRRAGLDAYAKTLFGVGNAGIVLALLTTLGDIRYFTGAGLRTSGILLVSSAAALLIGSYAYEDKVLAYVSSGMVLAASFFLVRVPGSDWYLAAPALATAAGVLIVMGFIDSKVFGDHDGTPFIYSGVIAILGILVAVAGKDLVFNIPRIWKAASDAEILNSMITAAVASALLWVSALIERKRFLGYLASSAMVYASLVGMGYWQGSVPLWCLLEATVVAGSLLIIGALLERFADTEWSLTAYIPGFVVAGAATVAAGIFYLPVISGGIIPALALHRHAYLGAVGSAIAMTVYLVAATVRTGKPGPLYGACVTAAVAGLVQAHAVSRAGWVHAVSGGGVNYGMLLVPLAVAFGIAGHVLRRAGRDDLATPPLAGFAAVAAFAFVSQFVYLYSGTSAAVAITFGALAVLAAAETVTWERGEFIYPGFVAALMLVRELVAMGLRGTGAEMNYMLYMTLVAGPLLVAGAILAGWRRGEKYSVPMLVSGGAFAAVGFFYQVAHMAHGFTYSVCIYMGAWALISAACAVAVSNAMDEGTWREAVPEIALVSAIVHGAVGTGWLAWTLSHQYQAVAITLAGLGSCLAVAFVSLRGRAPRWVARQLCYGSMAVGLAGVACSLQATAWNQYYASVICIGAVAMSAFLIGFETRAKAWFYSAMGGYAALTLVSFLSFVGREAGAVTRAAMLWQCASLAVTAAFCIAVSELADDIFANVAGHVFAAAGWIVLGWVLDLYPANAGYWLACGGALVLGGAFVNYTRDSDDFAAVGWAVSAGLFAAAVIHSMAMGFRTEAIITLSMALGLSAGLTLLLGRDRLAYLPLAISVIETVYIMITGDYRVPDALGGLVLMGPALLYLGIGRALGGRRDTLSDIFLQFAAGFTVMGTVAELVVLGGARGGTPDGGMLMVGAFFTAAAIYAAIGFIKGYGFMGHVSFAHFSLGYVLILVNGEVSMPHLYCLPAGIYLIALGYWAERAGKSKLVVQMLHLAGFCTLALSSLIPSLNRNDVWNTSILLTESVVALVVAFWQRRTVFLGAGLTFIVIDGIVKLWTPASQLHWSIYAVLVGALVLVGGILFETRRELLLDKGMEMRDALKAWR